MFLRGGIWVCVSQHDLQWSCHPCSPIWKDLNPGFAISMWGGGGGEGRGRRGKDWSWHLRFAIANTSADTCASGAMRDLCEVCSTSRPLTGPQTVVQPPCAPAHRAATVPRGGGVVGEMLLLLLSFLRSGLSCFCVVWWKQFGQPFMA